MAGAKSNYTVVDYRNFVSVAEFNNVEIEVVTQLCEAGLRGR